MKRITFALGLVVATALAAPLEAQSRNDGPWWDPANTGGRSGTDARVDDRRVDRRDGRIYNDGRIYDSRRADGRWHAEGRDRYGNIIYVRTRYDRNGNLIREVARRDRRGRYDVIQRRVIQSANRRHDGRYDNRDRNDRWDQNDGHDNGRHNGKYKNKNKNKNKGRR